MPRRTTYELAGEPFTTKEAVKKRVQGILWSSPCGERITGTDYAFLCALLELHPSPARKIGPGIHAIDIRQNPVYPNTRGFWLLRVDGTETDFSYLECLTHSPLEKKFRAACRMAVEADIIRFRRTFFQTHGPEVVCPVTGELVNERTAHVDHTAPQTFEQLVQDFLAARPLVLSDVIKSSHDDGEIVIKFSCPAVREAWIAFHREHARLRMVSRTANLSLLRRTARTDATEV